MNKTRLAAVAALASGAMLAGCAGSGPLGGGRGSAGSGAPAATAAPERVAAASGPTAMATLSPTQGNSVRGTVTFQDMGDHVMAHVRVSGLQPNSAHGFHVHEKGDCSSPDATSAGGHFNPTGRPHGPQDAEHHAGDMPNLRADGSGNAEVQQVLRGMSVGSGVADITGRAVVVHAQPDDYKSQPAGNSGARVACGVIAQRR
jgi:Cu-Zn family superoxide dismutase